MTVPSGADVTIGTDDFFIEESLPEHWIHALADAQTFFSVQEAGPRVQHATLFHNNRYWYQSDWTAGEGAQSWGNQVDNDAYDQGYVNTRIPGQFTTRPARGDATTGFTAQLANANQRLLLHPAGGLLWAAAGTNQVWYSSDAVTWTAYSLTGLSANQVVRSITGDGPYLYVMVSDTPAGAGKVKLLRLDSSHNQTTVLNDTAVTNVDTSAIVHHAGNVFAWNGATIRAYKITDSTAWPFTNGPSNLVIQFTDEQPVALPLYADAIALDAGVAFMGSYLGDTRIYQYKDGAASQIWQMPKGFTGHRIAFNGGLLFIAGEYENRAALFTMSMQTLQSTFVGYVRPWQQGFLMAAGAGPGSQVILLHSTQGFFIYDYLTDAISPLDYHYSNEANANLPSYTNASGVASVTTFAGNRVAIIPSNSTDFLVVKWQHDLTQGTGGGSKTVLYSPEWDFGFVNASKVLLGVFFECRPLVTGDSVVIQYKLEEDSIYNTFPSDPSGGAWGNLGTASFAGDGAITTKYFDLAVAGASIKFRHLRLRYQLTGKPYVKQVSPRVEIGPGQETFTMILRLRNEVSGGGGFNSVRPSDQQRQAEDMRATLWAYIRSRTPVTFLDGYSWRETENKYDTYTVVVEEPQDDIDINSQGEMKVTLRRVDGNSMA